MVYWLSVSRRQKKLSGCWSPNKFIELLVDKKILGYWSTKNIGLLVDKQIYWVVGSGIERHFYLFLVNNLFIKL